ncbi:MAG: hypothetical protein K8L99_05055 [Anaerolineae bacterium]|nr:hypothetical protein [Anaerolineae bacterium]
MSIEVSWANPEKTVIVYAYEGRWSMEQFNNSYQQARKLMDTVQHPVDFIIDVRNSSLLPSGILSRGRNVVTTPHPNEGRTAIVGANTFVRSMLDLFSRLYGERYRESKFYLAPTMDEAHKWLSTNRAQA